MTKVQGDRAIVHLERQITHKKNEIKYFEGFNDDYSKLNTRLKELPLSTIETSTSSQDSIF